MDRAQAFVEMSTELTGFGRVELAGTGMTDDYLRALDEALPAGLLDKLLAQWRGAGSDAVLQDPTFGPVARNIVLLWYRGTWSKLPEDWRAANGASPHDADRVVSGAAYRAGLQWVAAGAHPAGAGAQGFGAWALPPAGAGA